MIYILFFVLLVSLITLYKKRFHYLLCPPIIVIGVFTLSVSVASINIDVWYDISMTTLLVVLSGVFSFVIGSCIAGTPCNRKTSMDMCEYSLYIPKSVAVLSVLFMLYITYLDYVDLVNYVGPNALSLVSMVSAARMNTYIEEEIFSHSTFLIHCLYLCKAMTLIFLYYIIDTRINKGQKVHVIFYGPVILFFIQALLSTGRTEFIYILYAIFVIYYIIKKNRDGWSINSDSGFYMNILVIFSVFIAIFFGLSVSRKNGEVDFWGNVGGYVGSSIAALNKYVNDNGLSSTSLYFGEQTQILYYSILNALHLSNKSGVVVLEPIYFGKGESFTNIYTALYRYLHDYGYLGMCVIMSIEGFIFTKMFNNILKNGIKARSIIIYAFFTYPIVEMSIEERFFSSLLTARTVFCILYIGVLYKLIFRKQMKVI